MSTRPDLVECWVFRVPDAGGDPEYLLIRRAPGRIFAGLWQCVTGRIEPGERVTCAALREVEEETGLAGDAVEAFYDLDLAASFYDEGADAVVTSVIFAVRVTPGTTIRRSAEHDGEAWVDRREAVERSIWPAYREAVERIEALVADPDRAHFFELGRDGRRLAR